MALRHRDRGHPMPEVQAQIAQIAEELPLTAAFALVATRLGAEKTALGVVAEQRARVDASRRVMLRELTRQRRHRIHAALAGVAAVLMLGSASFAAYRTFGPPAHAGDRLIRSASAKLAEAASASDATQAATIVGEVHRTLSSLEAAALTDPSMRADVGDLLTQEWQILNAKLPASSALADQVRSLAQKMKVTLPPEPKPSPAQPPAGSPPPATPPTAAPAKP